MDVGRFGEFSRELSLSSGCVYDSGGGVPPSLTRLSLCTLCGLELLSHRWWPLSVSAGLEVFEMSESTLKESLLLGSGWGEGTLFVGERCPGEFAFLTQPPSFGSFAESALSFTEEEFLLWWLVPDELDFASGGWDDFSRLVVETWWRPTRRSIPVSGGEALDSRRGRLKAEAGLGYRRNAGAKIPEGTCKIGLEYGSMTLVSLIILAKRLKQSLEKTHASGTSHAPRHSLK